MTEKKNMQALSFDDLEQVSGGKSRIVRNDSAGYAELRDAPNGTVVERIYNGENVYTTGRIMFSGGITWYEVHYGADSYWIDGSLIGY